MHRSPIARSASALRCAALLAALAWMTACRQTPAPENASAPAPAAGQVVPVNPNPAPAPTPATASPAASAPEPTPTSATPPAAATGNQPPRKAVGAKAAAAAASPKPAAKPTAAAPTAQPAPAATSTRVDPKPAAPSLDLDSLEQRLRDTKAIGVFTKLSLKNQVDDLLDEVRQYHRNPANPPQPVVRRQFEGLILKVLSSLQGGDPQLANTIAASREALWGILMDPEKFSKI